MWWACPSQAGRGQPRLRAQADTGKAWRPKKNQVRHKRRSNSRKQRGFAVGDWRSVMRLIFVIYLIPRVCPRIAYYGTANNPEARAGRFASANPARLNPALQDTGQSAGYAAYEAAWRALGSGRVAWRGHERMTARQPAGILPNAALDVRAGLGTVVISTQVCNSQPPGVSPISARMQIWTDWHKSWITG